MSTISRNIHLALIGVFLGASGFCHAEPPTWFRWLDREFIKRIELNGYRRLGYHTYTVQGDQEAFNSLNLYGQGDRRFTDVGQTHLRGHNVLGFINFEAQILDSRFNDPQGQKFSIDFIRKGFAVNLGDIQGSLLNTNRFMTFSKTLKGGQVGFSSGHFQAKVLRSESKGSARTVVIPGNNSSGPYYLQSSQIIEGSEQVRIDDQQMQIQRDYTINYELGSITFINRIVSPTSSLVISYEALGFNSDPGLIQGGAVAYDFGRFGKIGLSAIQQRARGSVGLSQRTERFQGFGAPSTPYILQFEPLQNRPILIRVDGVLQTEGIDYIFDPNNASIFYFRRFVPPTSTVEVTYTPKPRETLDGGRDAFGIDYRIPLGSKGKNGELTFSQASGRLRSENNPLSGTARGVDLRYKAGIYEFTGSLRDVPEGYVSVESRGFNRNERAGDWGITATPTPYLSYGLSGSNSSVKNRSTAANGAFVFTNSRFTTTRGFATYQPDSGKSSWSLEETRTRSNFAGRSTELDSTSLSSGRKWKSFDLRFGLERQQGRGPVGDGSQISRIGINTARLNASYSPSQRFNLQGTGSISAIDTNGAKSSGRDYSLATTYRPSDKLSLIGSYALSDSGSLATLGQFQTGYGYGYDGNGFSSGSTNNGFLGATDYRNLQFNVQYTPSDRFTVDARVRRTTSSGSVSSNSQTTAYGLGASWDAGRGNQVALSLDRSATQFIDSPLSSSATTLDFFLNGAPPGHLSYRLGASLLLSGGNSQFKQDSASYEASLAYRLGKRHNLSMAFLSGRTNGYYPQNDFEASFTYQYQIYRNLAFNASYRLRKVLNLDPLLTTGAYRSSGFDFEFAFNFGGL